ncbi:multidrug resistance protein 1 [Gonapodya prolifera JEL478]|uniref:Multidrug resistance protein 1 n=1 Tax=Gonapodya prolifera (strain JEL478) TaxID=1344416 RepID=A0A139A848_GONPJ|nr:multidrug resistance protein 1 [Gonapodya prolifera JEL478]|eukprot:KXS12972.1 multidrug resistance protein 1 [Gonapodya prolifera JEL478]
MQMIGKSDATLASDVEIPLDDVGETDKLKPSAKGAEKDGFLSKLNIFGSRKEDTVGDKDEKPKDPSISYLQLFRFAEPFDYLLIFVALSCACINGVMQPLMAIPMGDIILALATYRPELRLPDGAIGSESFFDETTRRALILYLIIGLVGFVAAYLQFTCIIISAERQLKRMREEYFRATLRQEIGWHETGNATGELTSRLQADTTLVRNGMAEKFGVVVQAAAQFVAGLLIGFSRGWKMALVLTATFPIAMAIMIGMVWVLNARTKKQQEALGEASAVAEQAISNVRTVAAFGGQERNLRKYEEKLEVARKSGVQVGLATGTGMGFMFAFVFILYGFGLWYGSTLVQSGEYDGSKVIAVFFSILIGIFSVGQMAPEMEALASATGAAYRIWNTIDRQVVIDATSSQKGLTPPTPKGRIEFRSVGFTYPSRKDVKVLDDFSLLIEAGKTVALVGASGSGKSTIVKLIERFYDPDEGAVSLDGEDLKNLNVRWLRRQIGIVSQEPVLFDGSIRSNILMGLADPVAHNNSELDTLIHAAVKLANADFVWSLPHGIDTGVGERGLMLSGGQKQRIAIARAVISNPVILLLDEATSALDTAAERQVQKALDQASANRTTIVIAHRLSTVKNANIIIVMDHGKIVESGSHNDLLQRNGPYAELVRAQELETGDADDNVEGDVLERGEGTSPLAAGSEKKPSVTRRSSKPDIATRRASSGGIKIERLKSSSDIKKAEEEEKAKRKQEDAEYLRRSTPWRRVMLLNAPEYGYMFVGAVAAAVMGVVFPLSSVVFTGMTEVFAKTGDDLTNGTRYYTLLFLAIGVADGLAFFFNLYCFSYSGEGLTTRIRKSFLRALMYQEISYFDNPRRSTGALTAKLAEDAAQVKGLFGQMLGVFIEFIATVLAGAVLAFINGWKLTLAILAVFPLLGFGAYIEQQQFTQIGGQAQLEQVDTNKLASEALSNISTVAMLTKEKYFGDLYKSDLESPFRKAVKAALRSGFGAAAASGGQFLVLTFAWWYGCTLVKSGEYTGTQVQNVVWSVLFASASIGRVTASMPSISKAKIAALSIFDVLDRTPELDAKGDSGAKPEPTGEASLQTVDFKYPFRSTATVLKSLNLDIPSRKSIALVGPSGFYDPTAGAVTVDGVDVRQWNVKTLRQRLAIVGQEPVLFEGTIAENIAYGSPEGTTPTQEDIESAARKANAYGFITGLPDGFQTRVGERGSLLSGGQKQRIAIARAAIRQPNLLLLDEATSALDSESEKVVSAALDDASEGRTTIIIAHRLSTIQNCDRIYVIQGGSVIEEGNHLELLSKRGMYW